MSNDNNLFGEFRELIQRQIKEAYMEGIHKGAETACAVIYQTMKIAGLEKDNFLFYLLNDIAKQHGCEDLAAAAAKLQPKTEDSSDTILS